MASCKRSRGSCVSHETGNKNRPCRAAANKRLSNARTTERNAPLCQGSRADDSRVTNASPRFVRAATSRRSCREFSVGVNANAPNSLSRHRVVGGLGHVSTVDEIRSRVGRCICWKSNACERDAVDENMCETGRVLITMTDMT
jgi:hypothetical protein